MATSSIPLGDRVLKLLEVARYAPSGGNLQPWNVYFTDNADVITLYFGIDEQMEEGQYADLGIFIQTIKLLCDEYQLFASKLKFLSKSNTQNLRTSFEIGPEQIIFCSMDISHLSVENKRLQNDKRKLSTAEIDKILVRAKL